MKFVADENFPQEALRLLRQCGFDVASIAETNPGLPDTEVLGMASAEGRTLLTYDEVLRRSRLPSRPASFVWSHPVPSQLAHANGICRPSDCHATIGRRLGRAFLRRQRPQDPRYSLAPSAKQQVAP
ncbi:MAG: DUF5615 family PIN-like protein [Bryobacteraceae bacterium]|nr:DUF5615 family PIN-like protein [Bryobacteraceae bacterium]